MTTRPTTSGSPERSLEPSSRSWLYGSRGHVRAVWRIAIFVSICIFADQALRAIIATPLSFVSLHTAGIVSGNEIMDALAALIAIAIMLRNIDSKSWSAVALEARAWRAMLLANGVAIGALSICVTIVVLFALGAMHFVPDTTSTLLTGDASHNNGTAWLLSALRIAGVLVPAALFEELVFRGYLWRVFEDSFGPGTSLVVTSLLFGLVHLQNPGVTVLAIANVMIAGVCLGMIRAMTQSLPAAWAAHFMWNWVMAALFHVPVSGFAMGTPGYRAEITGREWLGGGSWGPEGGAACTAVLLAAIVVGARADSFASTFTSFRFRAANGARSE